MTIDDNRYKGIGLDNKGSRISNRKKVAAEELGAQNYSPSISNQIV